MKEHSILNLFIFTSFLLSGYTLSTSLAQNNHSAKPTALNIFTLASNNSILSLNNNQRSILLINVKSINSSNPQLVSIWLATYFPTETSIRLLPIFPAGRNLLSDFEKQLDHSFQITKVNGSLVIDQRFTTLLEDNNYWWSGYFIVDDYALTQLLDSMGGIDLNGKTISGDKIVKELPNALENPMGAYSMNVEIIHCACNILMTDNPDPEIKQIATLMPNHILTDLDMNQVQTELGNMYSINHALTCRFPMLEISQMVH